jgi:hypothetical protein
VRAILLRKPPLHGGKGEDFMTRQQYGVIATVAGAAMAAAWWWRRRDWVAEGMSQSGHSRGELIYSNTPSVSER